MILLQIHTIFIIVCDPIDHMSNFKEYKIPKTVLRFDLELDDESMIADQLIFTQYGYDVLIDHNNIEIQTKTKIVISKKTNLLSFIIEPA